MSKYLLISLLVLILIIPSTFAVCTTTLGKDKYFLGESILITSSCSGVTEKNVAYQINITNETGYVYQTITGTTPTVQGTSFFNSYTIPSAYAGNFINVNMTGTNLEGTDIANISNISTSSLLISNINTSSKFLIGKIGSFRFEIHDENNLKVNNARCTININNGDTLPIFTSQNPLYTYDGIGFYSFDLSSREFSESTEYSFSILCICPKANTSEGCFDENGNAIESSAGYLNSFITTNKWLSVNTVVSKSVYEMREEMNVCANVTNEDFNGRVATKVYHQVRCSSEIDNNSDLDRALIISDDEEAEERGINNNVTQMQCKRFVIPEPRYLQGKTSECYASTSVWVLDAERNVVIGYPTTSEKFNITSDTLNLDPDWERVRPYEFNTIVNLSSVDFIDYNATVSNGFIDLRLTKLDTENIDPTKKYGSEHINFENMLNTNYIKNLTATQLNGSSVEIAIESVDNGFIEIELRNVDLRKQGYYNVTMLLNSFEERGTSALEDIANKTGTFIFTIDAPINGVLNKEMNFSVYAEIESTESNKETKIVCSILDNLGIEKSQTSWNKMIYAGTPYNTTKSILVPSNLNISLTYTLSCKMSFYTLGSQSITATDTFNVIDGTFKTKSNIGKIMFTDIDAIVPELWYKGDKITIYNITLLDNNGNLLLGEIYFDLPFNYTVINYSENKKLYTVTIIPEFLEGKHNLTIIGDNGNRIKKNFPFEFKKKTIKQKAVGFFGTLLGKFMICFIFILIIVIAVVVVRFEINSNKSKNDSEGGILGKGRSLTRENHL